MDKRTAALAALENHARRYKVTIPERLRAFYTGDFAAHDGKYATASVLSWGKGTFQLALTPPSWLDKDDDAVNGPGGDWEDAKYFLPLFVTDQSLYLVADLRTPACSTGWYHEEESMCAGVGKGEASLDAFLASLASEGAGEIVRPADPKQTFAWAQDFGDDSPRMFDAVRDAAE